MDHLQETQFLLQETLHQTQELQNQETLVVLLELILAHLVLTTTIHQAQEVTPTLHQEVVALLLQEVLVVVVQAEDLEAEVHLEEEARDKSITYKNIEL